MHIFKKQLNVWLLFKQGSFHEELSLRQYLQHYSTTTRKCNHKNLQIYDCACGLIGKSTVIKYHAVKSCINGKSRFDQLTTASSSTSKKAIEVLYNYNSIILYDKIKPTFPAYTCDCQCQHSVPACLLLHSPLSDSSINFV